VSISPDRHKTTIGNHMNREDSERTELTRQQLLVRKTLAGDRRAFGELVTGHQAEVRAYLAVRLRNVHDVDDLAQEVFLVAYSRLDRFDASRPLGPWLRGIAEKLWLNHIRKRRPAPVGLGEQLENLVTNRIVQRLSEQPPSAIVAALHTCLESLTEKARQLVTWRYEEGLDIAEIRDRLKSKHSAVTMALFRVRRQLVRCIRSRGGKEGARA
jgi:RNA polymerase sigma-70 factor